MKIRRPLVYAFLMFLVIEVLGYHVVWFAGYARGDAEGVMAYALTHLMALGFSVLTYSSISE